MTHKYTLICERVCVVGLQGAPFETELEYLAEGCQGDPLVQSAVLSFQQQTALKVDPAPPPPRPPPT